jgi:membrane protease YdiL (CAAX protease family)
MGPPKNDRYRLTRSDAPYALAVVITVVAIISQYFVPQLLPATQIVYGNLLGDILVAYGIPILAFVLLVGVGPLKGWRRQMAAAVWQGFRWYGAMLTLALVLTIVLVAAYLAYDPSALAFLNRPNPALQAGASNPWLFVAISFVVGALEETIFRGWIFGYWLGRTSNWVVPAIWTSALFAAMHLYYGVTYGPAAPLIFPTLFLTGFAFAATFQASQGNLVVISGLHGATDAAAYLTLISTPAGLAVRYGLMLVGLIVAVVDAHSRSARGRFRLSAREINDPPLPWQTQASSAPPMSEGARLAPTGLRAGEPDREVVSPPAVSVM